MGVLGGRGRLRSRNAARFRTFRVRQPPVLGHPRPLERQSRQRWVLVERKRERVALDVEHPVGAGLQRSQLIDALPCFFQIG